MNIQQKWGLGCAGDGTAKPVAGDRLAVLTNYVVYTFSLGDTSD